MIKSLQRIAPYLLLLYIYLLCFFVTQLPLPFEKFKDLNYDILPRLTLGISVLVVLFIYFSKIKITEYLSKEWVALNVFILFSFVALYTLFRETSFGLNGLIGDAYFNAAMITKYKYFNSITDFNYAQLTTSYPALYHFFLGKYAFVFNIESYTAIQHGYILIYCLCVVPVFFLFKRVVGATAAIGFIIFIFLNYPVNNLYKPYEFITAVIFLGWWIYYIEKEYTGYKNVLIGGVIGAVIFTTYYYWFFIAAVYLFIKLISEFTSHHSLKQVITERKGTLAILLTAAIISSFYWLPLAIQFARFGVESLQNMWMTSDMAEFNFLQEKSITANAITGIGAVLAFIYKDNKVMRVCRWMIVTLLIWFTLGYVMLYISKPTVSNKIHYLVFATCGLSFFNWLFNILEFKSIEFKNSFTGVAFTAIFIMGADNFLEIKNHSFFTGIKGVKTTPLQHDKARIEKYKNKVMLTDRQHINALVPAHYFININAHFSHPASQFRQRIFFLKDLQQIQKPDVLAWFLAYNKFDKTDLIFFSNSLTLNVYDDNYPWGHIAQNILLSDEIFTSKYIKYFDELPGEQGIVYELLPPPFDLKNSFTTFEIALAEKYSAAKKHELKYGYNKQ